MGDLIKRTFGVAMLAGGLGFGCVLFVDAPKDVSGTCHFAGETATCGSCLVRACQTLVNQCCADGVCRSEVTDLDACAQTGGAACTPIAHPATSTPAGDALASCLVQQCDKECGSVAEVPPPGETPATSTSCTAQNDGKSCSCQVPAGTTVANTGACKPTSVPNAQCCADLDWPLAGTKCDCRTVTCATTNGGNGCTCTTFGEGPLTSCTTGGNCCEGSSGGCECGAQTNVCALVLPGTVGFKSVPSCMPSTVSCGNRKAVSRCSAQ